MSIEIQLRGEIKRGLLGRGPSVDETIGAVEAWARKLEVVESTECSALPGGARLLAVRLHPAAPPLAIAIDGPGGVIASAETSDAGPGYHEYVCELFRRMPGELPLRWTSPAAGSDPSGFFETGDRPRLEAAMLDSLVGAVGAAGAARPIAFGLPEENGLEVPAPLLTRLGPRDQGWLERLAADRSVGRDVFPWWEPGTGAAFYVARALARMWTEVRWRAPLDEGERQLQLAVVGDLERAYRLSPELAFPVREWQELAGFVGSGVPSLPPADPATPLAGYRRGRVTVRHGDWTIALPGSFAVSVGRDGLVGGDGRRALLLQSLRADRETGDPEAFLRRVRPRAGAQLRHEADALLAEATFMPAERLGDAFLLDGAAASGIAAARLRVTSTTAEDRAWAEETWRSLRPLPIASLPAAPAAAGATWAVAPGIAAPGEPNAVPRPDVAPALLPVAELPTTTIDLKFVGRPRHSHGMRALSGHDLLVEIRSWLEAAEMPALEWVALGTDPAGLPTLFVQLHPTAEPIELTGVRTGTLIVSASTLSVGPGYHAHVCDLLDAIGETFSLIWTVEAGSTGDPTGFYETRNRDELELAVFQRIRAAAGRVLELRRAGAGGCHVFIRRGVLFEVDAPIVTALGPRDEDWLEHAARYPGHGAEILPWWSPEVDGAFHLRRAECRMWTNVQWRPPLDDVEARTQALVLADLERAQELDPGLPFPTREWIELAGYARRPVPELPEPAEQERYAAPIGYRRGRVVAAHGPWQVRVPGAFAIRSDGGAYKGTDGRRAASLFGFELPPNAPQGRAFIEANRHNLRGTPLVHATDDLLSEAAFRDLGGAFALEAHAVAARHGVAFEARSSDPADRDWAVETWRTLRYRGPRAAVPAAPPAAARKV